MTAAVAEQVRWACPDGRLALRADAPRDEWLAARRTGIGSSDASAVLGLSRYASPFSVWAEKTGHATDDADNDAMEWGRRLEPLIASWWSDRTGIPIRRAGLMRSRTRPWQLASVDRLAGDGSILEVKTLGWRVADDWWDDGQPVVPDHAEVQVQHQLAVTGRSHAHVVGLQDGRTPLLRTVLRDEALIADLVQIETRFWEQVQAGEPPAPDASEATTRVLTRLWDVDPDGVRVLGPEWTERLQQLEVAKAAEKAAAADRDLLENQLRAELGPAEVAVLAGMKVATWKASSSTRIDVTALREQRPDVAAEFETTTTSRRLTVPKKPKEYRPDGN